MAILDDKKALLNELVMKVALDNLDEAVSKEETILAAFSELPAARRTSIKTKIADIKTEVTTLRQDINGTADLAALKEVWRAWIAAESNPDPDPRKNRNKFRRTLGVGNVIPEQ